MAGAEAVSDAFFESVLASMPAVEFAVAYGSGVFAQVDTTRLVPAAEADAARHGRARAGDKMVDFIFAVADPIAWHAANLRANAPHYSALGWLGPRATARVQCSRFGAGVYFNTLVPHTTSFPPGRRAAESGHAASSGLLEAPEERLIKYGVISVDRLRVDLLEWETLYVSGRLHKPVRVLVRSASLEPALQSNLRSAVAAGLLLLPARFTERELFTAIATLSYAGDVRMGLAEHPRKVERIVAGSERRFRELYASPLASAAPDVVARGPAAEWSQGADAATTTTRLRALPARVRARVLTAIAPPSRGAATHADLGALEAAVARAPRESLQAALRACLSETVRSTSAAQSLKGLLTAGAAKSAVYLARKLGKVRSG